MAKIRIPSQLRNEVENQSEVEIAGSNVGEALSALSEKFPALKPRLFDENGKLRRYVNIYLDDEDIRFLDDLETTIEAGSELALVPAIAGGLWNRHRDPLRKALELTIPAVLIHEPILYTMITQFSLVVNIREAQVGSDKNGKVLLDIEGSPAEMQKAMLYLAEKDILYQEVDL